MKKLRIIQLTILGLLLYIGFVLANVPAKQVIYRLAPEHVVITDVDGSIWSGTAATATANGITLNNIRWDVSLLSLFKGQLGAHIYAGNARNRDEISLSGFAAAGLGNTLHADNLTVRAPARLLAAYVPMPLPVKLDGQLNINLNDATFNGQVCQVLDGKGEWRGAAVSGTKGWIELGAFTALLGCEQQHITANVKPPNQFNLTADARISPQLNVTANGEFKPAQSLPKEVHQAAMLFGAANSAGFYKFSF